MALSVSIICIGKAASLYSPVYEHYQQIIKPFASVSIQWIKSPGGSYADVKQLIERESRLLSSKWTSQAYPVVLAPDGKLFDTNTYSTWIGRHRSAGRHLVFTVGGAYGLSETVKKQAKETISLSSLTMCHTLAVAVLMEQTYRALTILNGYPYHK
jgi:23S rRNA (pseudouridine1915-N3)-methyltransferase